MNEQYVLDVLADIEETEAAPDGPLRFDMSDWMVPTTEGRHWCGTTACLAGFAAIRGGWVPVVENSALCFNPGTGVTREVDEVAKNLLGFDYMESDWIFYVDDLDGVYSLIAEWMSVDEQVLRDKVAGEVQAREAARARREVNRGHLTC